MTIEIRITNNNLTYKTKESAGAVSVAYQMISPLAQGLFHRGISNSGGLAGPSRTGVAKQQSTRLAELMNCPVIDDTFQIIQCLRQVPAEDLVNAGLSFRIVIESFDADEPAFIDQRNYNNRFSSFASIPWLVGMNSEESLLNLSGRKELYFLNKTHDCIKYFSLKKLWKMMYF